MQHSKVLYRCGVRRGGKTEKHGKVGGKRKWWVLAQPPYYSQGNGRQSSRVEPFNQWDRPPDAEETQRAGIVKDWKDKRDRGCIPNTFT